MKYAAIFLIVLVLAAACFGLYAYANSKLIVASIQLKAYPAAEQESEFLRWQAGVDNGAVAATAFSDSLPGAADDYSFFAYTLRIQNKGLITADMVEVQVAPVNGDVLAYSTQDVASVNANTQISARGEKNVWCVLLTNKQNQENHIVTRSFYITYYIWGIPMTVTATYA